ncbi:MAG: NAD-glutamate dehydrogenase [Steroidobacteraceae bacterium]
MKHSVKRVRAVVPPARARCIAKIVAAARGLPQRPPSDWLERYFAGVDEQDLQARPPLELAQLAKRHWQLGRRRPLGQPIIDIVDSRDIAGINERRSYLLLVTDDRPFLVDSVSLTLARYHIAVHLLIHPVLGRISQQPATTAAQSALESWQLIEIDRQFDGATISALTQELHDVLIEVEKAVTDWAAMRSRIKDISAELARRPIDSLSSSQQHDHREALALLDWVEAGNFVLLGIDSLRGWKKREQHGRSLGILSRSAADPLWLTDHAVSSLQHDERPLIITKSSQQSRIHRAGHLDQIVIKQFDPQDDVVGLYRIIGLWTSRAYFASTHEIPLIRTKVNGLIKKFGLDSRSHDGKAVLTMLENWPRDELFASSTVELQQFVRAAVNLYDRSTTRTLLRFDAVGDFWTCLIFIPRDRYNTEVRLRIENLLKAALQAAQIDSQTQLTSAGHARLQLTLRGALRTLGRAERVTLESAISEAALTWLDRLERGIDADYPAVQAAELKRRHGSRFSASYQNDIDIKTALCDLAAMESLSATEHSDWRIVRTENCDRMHLELRVVSHGEPLPIADLMPLFENFGLRLLAEHPWPILATETLPSGWIQGFEIDPAAANYLAKGDDAERLLKAMRVVQCGTYDNDALNQLVLRASLASHEVNLLRALCRYLLQTGLPFSLQYIAETLSRQADIAADLWHYFDLRHRPSPSTRKRAQQANAVRERLLKDLDSLESADEDRILRALLAVIDACLRSNFHARLTDEAATIALKLDPATIPGLPLPRPEIETWVFGPIVEGVHLRMGRVARGGLRWSDRREDFRTEILGLMKAQHVKNTLIVPVGAKGGFVVRRHPAGLGREEWLAQGVAAYQAYIGALLDITDNIDQGRIVPPLNVTRYDNDDPYLVVAADKGTATFSDIANAISLSRNFWLGDAFASGGSVGYDHKKMGITARGAWECVKRHFRELGIDTQTQEFSAIGIGDMSGDVFGNGMLLSPKIQLVAAFNHQHIFIDPNPDTARSFRERERLFNLPRSGWGDYRTTVLSKGGGVYARSAKTLQLSREACALLDLPSSTITPNELIQTILRLPVDLLWNGGIGTYVKASHETHIDASDRANDAVRVDAKDLGAKIVGEGGNLGLTPLARVEFALKGGRINADFIDNSAGVNTSDLEVNIKILLASREVSGRLARSARKQLLAKLEPQVAELALRNNYLQSQALSILQSQAHVRANELRVLIRSLERDAGLNRKVERLPDEDALIERQKRNQALTRPELAVIFSYAKLDLNRRLSASALPEDPYFAQELARYFPTALQRRFTEDIKLHRLRREIIVTATTNSIINRMGPSFALRAAEESGCSVIDVARAYSIAREIFDARDAWARLESWDGRLDTALQYHHYASIARALRHASMWLLARHGATDSDARLSVSAAVAHYGPGIRQLRQALPQLLVGELASQHLHEQQKLLHAGMKTEDAQTLADFPVLEWMLEVIDLAQSRRQPLEKVANLWFGLPITLKFDWIEYQIDALAAPSSLHATARRQLRSRAKDARRELVAAMLTGHAPSEEARQRWQETLTETQATGKLDHAMLSVVVSAMHTLTAGRR